MKDVKSDPTADARKEKEAIDKFQKEFFDKNKLIFNLTLDQYHAIINVMAKATIADGFYQVRELLAVGDPQKDSLIKQYNKAVTVLKKSMAPVAPKLVKKAKNVSTAKAKTA